MGTQVNKLNSLSSLARYVLFGILCCSTFAHADIHKDIAADKPDAWWSFDIEGHRLEAFNALDSKALSVSDGKTVGGATVGAPGPRPSNYPDFAKENDALKLAGAGARIEVKDPGKRSALDFDLGESITIEAWVNLTAGVANGQQVYIVGKGRTMSKTGSGTNQNYALRLRGVGAETGVNFLFRDRLPAKKGEASDAHWHRWTSEPRIAPRTGWHHVAVTYTFGKGDSIRGYIDGQPVSGVWDMGGKSDAAPVVDDDALWIGSSMGGSSAATFQGMIDEVAIHRRALDPKRIATRFKYAGPKIEKPKHELLAAKDIPIEKVRVDIIEGLAAERSHTGMAGRLTETYYVDALGFADLPNKYNSKGLITDRTNPFMVRATAKVRLAGGDYRILVRARNGTRLFVDGKPIASMPFISRNGSAHGKVPQLAAVKEKGVLPLSGGDQEAYVKLKLPAGEHVFQVETVCGGKGIRAELGELAVAIGVGDEPLRLLSVNHSSTSNITFTEQAWNGYVDREHHILKAMNAENRASVSESETEYWSKRHLIASQIVAKSKKPAVPKSTDLPATNLVDRFINAKLASKHVVPASQCDDYTFIRRVFLDTVGVGPTRVEVEAFIADTQPNKRARLIDKLLADERWADHWVSYWQDVLAENPGILKPKLNNTGPFRWWIYESFLDNKPMDRFATELIMMEGSQYGGGPAGFAMATQNDMPMAAKAHVIGKAFLGVEMKCARCHDAPHHPFDQRDLFNLAAMLDRKSVKVPKTSVVPVSAEEAEKLIIDITLKPGEIIKPDWPFTELAPAKIPAGVIRNSNDPRQRFAAILTSPHNERFTQVLANRVWKRLMGIGLVDPVDDWSATSPSHPKLLATLGQELIANGYNLKYIARLILNSRAYQREVGPAENKIPDPAKRMFASQTRRRMTAEQLVDSLLTAAGKDFHAEELNFDPEGRLSISVFLNLKSPRRAWYFTGMANERDRPALALPMAQGYVDVLSNFGWRETRQDPLTTRDQTPTVLQPLVIANGTVGQRITRLSDDSAFTAIALGDVKLEEVVSRVFLQVFARQPSNVEQEMFTALLADGFKDRVVKGAPIVHRKTFRTSVSWSNHLNAEATRIKYEMEQAARDGDPPTQRLATAWRRRMEDMVWALVNSPEFLFVP